MEGAAQKTDPATFEIVKNSLYKIAEEMRVVLAKTAYSPILKSAGDYSCGVFDAKGEMVAQGPDLPIHLGSMPDAVRAIVAAFAADVHEGDVFIHNDPYFGGSHLPDINVVRPAFHEGQLLGYACLRAHWPDVGSATPGSYGAVTEIFGEGIRLPPVRLISRGVLGADLEKVILANVRTPEERKGDLGARLAATLRATERLQALARRYDSSAVIDYMAQVMDYSERLARDRDPRACGFGRERHVPCPGRLCQPRDVPSRGRHGDGRARALPAGAGDGLQPRHIGDPDAGRRRSSHGPALCFVRNRQGRLWSTAEQGRHQLHRQRNLQYDEHAGGGHGDVVSGAHRALCDQPGLGRRGALSRRLRRGSGMAAPGRRGCDRRVVH